MDALSPGGAALGLSRWCLANPSGRIPSADLRAAAPILSLIPRGGIVAFGPAFRFKKKVLGSFWLNPVVWGIGEDQMERMLATPADAEIILKLYSLRTESLLRQARAWVGGEFWPTTADELLAVLLNPKDEHNAYLRQVLSYWEMAAAMVLHGAVSAELFVDCNGEGFFLLAKFAPILEAVRERYPGFLVKTSELVERFSAASQRYETTVKMLEARRQRMSAQ